MSIRVFLELVEFKAKTASVLPFLIGLCYSWYHYESVNIGLVALYFVAMVLFNMAIDILNNYCDYRNATEGHDYKQKTNIIGRENLSLGLVFWLMTSMIVLAALIGLWLVLIVGLPLLFMGLYCFAVGIFYSAGPRPLSSLPLGEFFSGSTMGFMITLICVYLNNFHQFQWNFATIFGIFIIALPNTLWIANLMLANNICDQAEDEKNQRYTLVHYLGKQRALFLFVGQNILAYVGIILSVVFNLAPWTVLLSLFTLPFVWKQTRLFGEKQVKRETFICAVRILAVGSAVQVLTYLLGIVIK